jgi:hypothetical protein
VCVYLEMRAVFLGLLVCLWVGVLHAGLVSPSMMHHGPLLTQVTLEGRNQSEVYHVYAVTYATAWSREFCVMAASASAHGFGLNVLGEGRQAHFDRDRFLDKLWSLRDFVVGVMDTTPQDMRTRTLILFFDGYDVLVNGKPKTLVNRFVHSRKKILFGAEKGCSGTREALAFKDNQCDPKWPSDKYTTTPFLNSGVFLGFVTEVDHLLTAAKNEYDSYLAKLQSDYGPIQPLHETRATSKGPWDPYLLGTDQQLICQLFAHEVVRGGQSLRSAIGMSLDYESQIFVNAYRMEIGREIVITAKGRVRYDVNLADCDEWDQARFRAECRQRSVRRLRRETLPVILHFNGRQKQNMMAVASQMRWPEQDHAGLWASEIYAVSSGARMMLKEACVLHMRELACGKTLGKCLVLEE